MDIIIISLDVPCVPASPSSSPPHIFPRYSRDANDIQQKYGGLVLTYKCSTNYYHINIGKWFSIDIRSCWNFLFDFVVPGIGVVGCCAGVVQQKYLWGRLLVVTYKIVIVYKSFLEFEQKLKFTLDISQAFIGYLLFVFGIGDFEMLCRLGPCWHPSYYNS